VHNVTQYPVCNNGVCGSRTFDFFVQYCPFGCSQGTCQNNSIDECSINSDCDDENPYTEDLCILENNTGRRICDYNQIRCLSDLDCNNSVSSNFCLNDYVYQTLIDYACINPGTPNSSCQEISSEDVLVEECLNGCLNGECKSSGESGSRRGGGGGRGNMFDDLPFIITPTGEILGQELSVLPSVITQEESEELPKKESPKSKLDFNIFLLLMFGLFILLLFLLIIILAATRKN
ncbi:MAG: hypothetical protein QXI33_03405, partial [Candidatus Pacearchaeota archaeon]